MYKRIRWQSVIVGLVLGVTAFTIIMPYIWIIINSLKPILYFYKHPYTLTPEEITWEAYPYVWITGSIGLYLKNSLFYATTVVVVQLVIDSLAAYAFARLDFKGRDFLFLLFLSTMVLPYAVILIPSYLIIHKMGQANSFLGVVMPYFTSAFGIFMLRQFFLGIPHELEDSAKIDGAGTMKIYAQIILPLAKPAMITLGIFLFMNQWRNFLWPLIVLSDNSKYPVTVGIALFREQISVVWPSIFATCVLASLPVIMVFLVARKYIIGGMAISGLKG